MLNCWEKPQVFFVQVFDKTCCYKQCFLGNYEIGWMRYIGQLQSVHDNTPSEADYDHHWTPFVSHYDWISGYLLIRFLMLQCQILIIIHSLLVNKQLINDLIITIKITFKTLFLSLISLNPDILYQTPANNNLSTAFLEKHGSI